MIADRHFPYDQPWPDDRPVSGYQYWLLLDAEAGRLRYDPGRYPIHGVPNSAVGLLWGGLLADGPNGPVLTEAGRRRLEVEKTRREDFADESSAPLAVPAVLPAAVVAAAQTQAVQEVLL
jgi:hypothetical protein